ncbi:MAG: 3-isopropylmalate dehydrogenase [Nitrospirae bacterium GWB2_47_37]|nr:MAG: 3-isopropylmalate dehydrogenase [Nitrospirae bacterium GWA2_46_11]OGW23604.1 MAG: 3-isopropylmalate dehydrogenase [Nitrospirae bacterium GWB2_47_37]
MSAKSAKKYNIAVIPGDGTGPEVVAEGIKALNTASAKFGFNLDYHYFDFGGERYLKTGETLPDSAIDEFRKFDAMFLGAIGHPDVKPGILETGILLKIRFALDQYINLRPVRLYPNVETPLKDKGPEHIDFVVIRENTGGIYTGHGGATRVGTPDEIATQLMIYDRRTVDRCLKYAFELKKKRNAMNPKYAEKPITLVHKRNVLTHAGDLWYRAFEEMGSKFYPELRRDYNHVDAANMWFVKNPEWFDVVVTENLFGDIITDLGAMIQGGLGVASGGNINPEGISMFEPMGGSAPKYRGQGVINPMAAIGAAMMMLDTLGEAKASQAVETSMIEVMRKMKSQAAGKMGYSTAEVGDLTAKYVSEIKE